jgi:hypothetical protein
LTTVITAPESFITPGYRVFLAGAIDMGMAEDWQQRVIDTLSGVHDLVLINPRRAEFTPDTLDEQIRWELEALEVSDLIMMYLPSSAKAPISFFEAGLYWKSGKLIIGAGAEFYRRRNLELTAERYGQTVFENLFDLVQAMSAHYNKWKMGR